MMKMFQVNLLESRSIPFQNGEISTAGTVLSPLSDPINHFLRIKFPALQILAHVPSYDKGGFDI